MSPHSKIADSHSDRHKSCCLLYTSRCVEETGAETVDEACQEKDVQMSERMKEELGKIIPLSKIYLNEVV